MGYRSQEAPYLESLDALPQTVAWLKQQGVEILTMSPTLYNRGGSLSDHEIPTQRLHQLIDQYNLLSQELDFIPSLRDTVSQLWNNQFKCMLRNSDIIISASRN